MPARTGTSCAAADAVREWGRSPCCAPSRARPPVVAHTAATVYKLDREPFLTAVLGHAPTQRQAERIADTRLAADAAPADSDTAG